MNRSNMFVVMLCGLLAAGSMTAAWYSPILDLAQTLKTQIVRYKKSSIGLASVVLCYVGFNKLRDWKIKREKSEILHDGMEEAFRHILLPEEVVRRPWIGGNHVTWGKRWDFRIVPNVAADRRSTIAIYDDYQLLRRINLP